MIGLLRFLPMIKVAAIAIGVSGIIGSVYGFAKYFELKGINKQAAMAYENTIAQQNDRIDAILARASLIEDLNIELTQNAKIRREETKVVISEIGKSRHECKDETVIDVLGPGLNRKLLNSKATDNQQP